MARGDVQVNNFVRGLITEASPLTFPQGASLDEVNFKLKKDGTRERRLGLDLETDYAYYDISSSTDILAKSRITAYRWTTPSGNADMEIGVVQIGKRLFFIDLLKPNPSAHILNGGMPLTSPAGGDDQIMNFATINNQLVAVSNALADPYLLTYDAETDVVHSETAPILVRDIWGVDDSIDVNYRPTTLSTAHHYNLLNQGWDPSIKTTCGDGINAIECTYNTFGVYPANSDHWSIGRVEDLTSADVWKYDAELASRNLINNGQVAKGHFIIPLFDRGLGRFQQTGLPVPLDRETRRISCVAAYAGRVFYSGIYSRLIEGDIRSPILSGSVLFSKPFFNKIDLVTCYQEADPTNPDINDIIDTDGGIIQIPECNLVVNLLATKESLFVFGYNGVWQIRGDEGGFRATSYQVLKVSDIGVYAPKSIVEANGAILFWGVGGIYSITPNQFGSYDTNNITLTTIQRLYNSIPDSSKVNVRGFFDRHSNTARWLHYSPETKVLGNPIDTYEVPVQSYVQIGEVFSSGAAFRLDVVGMSETLALITYTDGVGNLKARLITIDGMNLSIGIEQNLGVLSGTKTSVARLTATTALLVYFSSSNTRCRVVTITGSTVSIGAETIFATASANPKVETISSTEAIVSYKASVNNVAARFLTISGTSISAGAELLVSVNTTVDNQNIAIVDSTRAFISYLDTTGNFIKGRIVLISGTTITVPGLETNISNAGAVTSQETEIKMQNSTKGLVTWADAAGVLKSNIVAVNGTTIVPGTVHSYTYNGSVFSGYLLPLGDYILGYNNFSIGFANILLNTVGATILEGTNTTVSSVNSHEFTIDKINNNKVIVVWQNFSDSALRMCLVQV